MIDPKSLKALADACRKSGIKHFKNSELEFTLTDAEPPKSEYKKRQQKQVGTELPKSHEDIQSDILNSEALLFWSAGDQPDAEG